MKILFITSNRLGDGAISTSALDYMIRHHPDCEITVAGGWLVKGIYEQFPEVKEFIVLKKEPYSMHWYRLWQQVHKTKWDVIVDLRNSIISRLLIGKEKFIWGKHDQTIHKVDQIARCLRTTEKLNTRLVFKPETLEKAKAFVKPGEKVLSIGPTANWPPKEWPAEYFAELFKKLVANYAFDKVAVLAAPGEEATAYKVFNIIPEHQRVDVISKTSPEVGAAILSMSALYVGNDSGLLHCAAATGIPTLGLFGPSYPKNYSPYGKITAFVKTPESPAELLAKHKGFTAPNLPNLMTTLDVETVYQAAKKLLDSQANQ